MLFDENIGLTLCEGANSGVFYSNVFDSLEAQTQWFKLEVDSKVPNNTTIRLTFFANDTPYVLDHNDQRVDIYKVIRDLELSPQQKDKLFINTNFEVFINPSECIFNKLKGRYLWFKVEFFAQQSELPVMKKLKAHIRGKNWIDYLPEIYRTDSKSSWFTERYLYIFQDLYEKMETQIDNVDLLFNPEITNRGFLEWLAKWLNISNAYMWNDQQLRYFTKNALNIYKTLGTKESIITMVKLYTGEEPVIVENCKLFQSSIDENTKALYKNLYNDNPFIFTILVRNECIKSNTQYETLLKIIEDVKPAHMYVNLIVLQPIILLDGYSYMGVNTELSGLTSATLDGNASLNFTIL
jgi:phage tail-like protein